MHLFSALAFVYLCEVLFVSSQNGDVLGKVFIGTAENDTTGQYSFSVSQPQSFYSIPVYVDIYNASTPVTVSVTCGVSPVASGYSGASFSSWALSIPSNPAPPYFGSVSFSGASPGRMTELRCWCVSPAPFTKDSTISDAKLFTVVPAGVVNLYSSVYPMEPPYVVSVKLSQIAFGNSVTVTCEGLGLTFSPIDIAVGLQISQVTYTVQSNVAASVTISCRGQSTNNGYQFLSASSDGMRADVVKVNPIVSLIPNLSILNRIRMQAILSINKVPPDTATFSCSVSTVYSWSDATNITKQVGCSTASQPTPRPELTTATLFPITSAAFTTADITTGNASIPVTPTPPAPTNLTGYWIVQPTDFTFTTNDRRYLFRTMELSRTLEVASHTEELVVTRCCSSDPVANNPYLNSAASMVAAVTLTPTLFINWTIATATANMSMETPIVNPAYKNLAPCPCNLTSGACDANCCCDTDCTESDIAIFQCIEGLFGGMAAERSDDFCGAERPDTPGWFPIMCIHSENNAFLGYFFYPAGLIRNQTAFDATLTPYLNDYSFRTTNFILPGEPNGSQVGYKQGLAIKTGLQIPPATFQIGPNYMLTLPQQGLHGHTLWSAPVRYLVDTDTFWVQDMAASSTLCAINSPLSALTYAQSPSWGIATGPVVLREQGVAAVTSINVNFLCDPDVGKYVSSRSTYTDLVPSNVTKLFGTASDDANDCRFDEVTGAYVCGNYSVGGDPPQSGNPPRCSWDNGYTAPPQPFLNNVSGTCDNSVVRILYNFTWSGQAILYLNATLVLASVPLDTSATNASGDLEARPALLSQRFVTKFVSQRVNGTESSGQSEGMKVLPVSGNPGYNMNLPVISGISVENPLSSNESVRIPRSTSDVFVDTSASSRLSLWSPGVGSLCEGASKMPVLFGVGAMAECVLRLSFANLDNCDVLRKQVLSGQDSLMPSNYISLVGNPNADNLSDWTNIIREDISYIVNGTRASNTLSTEQTTQTTQTTTSLFSLPPAYNYEMELKGICHNVPSGIDLTIMYAVAGRSNNQPIHRIVGAKISYTLSTWQWTCENAATCRKDSNLVKSFILTSTATFVEVPATPQPGLSRYKSQLYSPDHVCKGGTCWRETFYPFTKLYNQKYAIAFGLSFIIFIIYFTVITSPFLSEFVKLLFFDT